MAAEDIYIDAMAASNARSQWQGENARHAAAEARHRDLLRMLDRIATALEQSNKDYADMVQRT